MILSDLCVLKQYRQGQLYGYSYRQISVDTSLYRTQHYVDA